MPLVLLTQVRCLNEFIVFSIDTFIGTFITHRKFAIKYRVHFYIVVSFHCALARAIAILKIVARYPFESVLIIASVKIRFSNAASISRQTKDLSTLLSLLLLVLV